LLLHVDWLAVSPVIASVVSLVVVTIATTTATTATASTTTIVAAVVAVVALLASCLSCLLLLLDFDLNLLLSLDIFVSVLEFLPAEFLVGNHVEDQDLDTFGHDARVWLCLLRRRLNLLEFA